LKTTTTHCWALAAILCLPCCVTLAAQPPVPGTLQPLVKLHGIDVVAEGPALIRFLDQDVFVAGDGTLVSVTVGRAFAAGSGFVTTIIRGLGSPALRAALGQAFYQDHIGTLGGVCNAELQPLGSGYTFGISWFGKGARTSDFTITNQGGAGHTCSPSETGVLQAIEAFQAGVIADPATQISSSVCTSSNQCPVGLLCCRACGIPDCAQACLRPAADGSCPLFP
jgi:hypothetical protein